LFHAYYENQGSGTKKRRLYIFEEKKTWFYYVPIDNYQQRN